MAHFVCTEYRIHKSLTDTGTFAVTLIDEKRAIVVETTGSWPVYAIAAKSVAVSMYPEAESKRSLMTDSQRRERSLNLGMLHESAAKFAPDSVALITGGDGERITYADLADRIAEAANALRSLGVEHGDRVALYFTNELSYLYLFFGAARIGAVPVPMNVQATPETLAYILDDSDADLLIASGAPDTLADAVDVVTAADTEVTVAVDGDPATVKFDGSIVSYAAAAADAGTERPAVDIAPDDAAFQPYTSGSTGQPKGVVLTHAGTTWNARSVWKAHLFDENERGIVATPLYHKNAMAQAVKPLFLAGGSVVIMDGFDPEAVLNAVEQFDVTYLTGVPAMYKLLLQSDALDQTDTSSVSWAVCGSDTVPESLHESFADGFNAPLLEAYGLTEGGPVVTMSPRWGIRKMGSAGLAIPGAKTIIVDPETNEELPAGEAGELLVSSPGVGQYYNRPDEATEAFEIRDGRRYLHTEDLVRKDDQGYHYIVGRLDDMLVVGGENVYPAEVEGTLKRHPAVDDVAVVSAPHAIKGEAPVAFVVTEQSVSEDELEQFFLDRGPAYAHPRRIFFRDRLPLTGTGKIDRDELEATARERIDGEL